MSTNVLKATKRLLDASRPFIFGMIHVPALPGTPLNRLKIADISKKVTAESHQYLKARVDGIIFENMHDLPYALAKDQGPEVVASMTRVCVDAARNLGQEAREKLLLGVQILAAANQEAMAVAQSAELDFIRAESFIFSHVADEGLMNACAGPLLRYKRQIGADNVAVFTDIKKKHSSHSITSDISIDECAHAAEFFLADALIVTGTATGKAAQVEDLEATLNATKLPVLIGSGIDHQNYRRFMNAHAFIVGSYFKKDGKWQNELDEAKITSFTSLVRGTRRGNNNC